MIHVRIASVRLKLCNARASGYGIRMTSPTPLISRLRGRLATLVWLLVFVVLAKGALAALCVVDGAAAANAGGELVQVTAAADAAATHDDDGDGTPCWHAGGGDCHCTCVHGSAIPAVALDWLAAPASSARIPLSPAASHPILIAPAFRPPIA